MQTEKVSMRLHHHHRVALAVLCALGSSTLSVTTSAKPIDFSAAASTDVVQQNVNRLDGDDGSLTTITVTPSVNATYQGPRANFRVSANLTYLDRENDTSAQRDTYHSTSYSGSLNVIDRLLVATVGGSSSYRSRNAGNLLFTDVINDNGEMVRTTSNSAGLQLTATQGDLIGMTGNANYSKVSYGDSANDANSIVGRGSDSTSVSVNLFDGDETQYYDFIMRADYQNTQRDNVSVNNSDLETLRLTASFDQFFYGDLALRLESSYEENQYGSAVDSTPITREFSTYGVGLTYKPRSNRYLAITANDTRSPDAQFDGQSFIGVDMQWAFTNRTSVAFSSSRRFYGRSKEGSIRYNAKRFRTSFNYSESVTNTSRLISGVTGVANYICPIDSTSIADCYLPDTLDYQPTIEEVAVSFNEVGFELDDRTILQKSATLNMGYQFNRISVSFASTMSDSQYLDEDRLRESLNHSFTVNYRLGNYTNVDASVSYNETDETRPEVSLDTNSSKSINARIGASRSFGKNLTADINLSRLERSGDLNSGIYGSDYTDTRITLGVSYRLD